jgi:hypothetical protein
MTQAAYLKPMNSVTEAIRKERDNRNLKGPVTLSFLLFWTHTHIYRPVLYDVARRVWGGLTANGRV